MEPVHSQEVISNFSHFFCVVWSVLYSILDKLCSIHKNSLPLERGRLFCIGLYYGSSVRAARWSIAREAPVRMAASSSV